MVAVVEVLLGQAHRQAQLAGVGGHIRAGRRGEEGADVLVPQGPPQVQRRGLHLQAAATSTQPTGARVHRQRGGGGGDRGGSDSRRRLRLRWRAGGGAGSPDLPLHSLAARRPLEDEDDVGVADVERVEAVAQGGGRSAGHLRPLHEVVQLVVAQLCELRDGPPPPLGLQDGLGRRPAQRSEGVLLLAQQSDAVPVQHEGLCHGHRGAHGQRRVLCQHLERADHTSAAHRLVQVEAPVTIQPQLTGRQRGKGNGSGAADGAIPPPPQLLLHHHVLLLRTDRADR